MRNINLTLIIFAFANLQLYSQNWEAIGNGTNWGVETVYVDSITNKIYVGGIFYSANGILTRNIAVTDGVIWDSLGYGNTYGQHVYAITIFHDTLYADGRYASTPSNFGGKFNGQSWDSLNNGLTGPIYDFKEINGELWASGFFDMAETDSCSMLAAWNGTSWRCLNNQYNNLIETFEFYHDTLVIAGNFFDSISRVGLARWNGFEFETMGHRLHGGSATVHTSAIYNDILYIGGYFLKAAGNEGNNIMYWNGSQWDSINGGDADNEINCMKVHNNRLYVAGAFERIGNINASKLAYWDGQSWHPVSTSQINGIIYSFDFLNNDIIIGGQFSLIDTMQINNIARFHDSTTTIIKINSISNNIICNGRRCLIEGDQKISSMRVINNLGMDVNSLIYISNNSIEFGNLPIGFYILEIVFNNKLTLRKSIFRCEK